MFDMESTEDSVPKARVESANVSVEFVDFADRLLFEKVGRSPAS